MAIRTKPKTRAAHSRRSNHVKVKPLRRVPGLATRKLPVLPAHRPAARGPITGTKSSQKSSEYSNGERGSPIPKMGVPQLIELPEEATVTTATMAGEVP